MGSTNFTEHYDIPLPLGSDKTTPMDYNQSMQAVDTALFTAQGDASDAKTGLATTNLNVAQNTQDIGSLAGRVTAVEGTVASQGTAITNLSTKIDGVEQDAQDMICAYNQASATASRNYAVGDYFIYNDVLYRVTQAITAGGTIVPDTNCTTTNIGTELNQLKSDLTDKASIVTASVTWISGITNNYTKTDVVNKSLLINACIEGISMSPNQSATIGNIAGVSASVTQTGVGLTLGGNPFLFTISNGDLQVFTRETIASTDKLYISSTFVVD